MSKAGSQFSGRRLDSTLHLHRVIRLDCRANRRTTVRAGSRLIDTAE
ncbi:MAG TPA: hypothetical protein VEN30_26545 [Paraburkholderia sp.]|nr:hypothetical protein [Paraburkholderia sp.]